MARSFPDGGRTDPLTFQVDFLHRPRGSTQPWFISVRSPGAGRSGLSSRPLPFWKPFGLVRDMIRDEKSDCYTESYQKGAALCAAPLHANVTLGAKPLRR